MTDSDIQELIKLLGQGHLSLAQLPILQQQMAEALREKHAEQPGLTHARGMVFAASPIEHLAQTLKAIHGGREESAIRGETPIDPTTGRPVSMYGNLQAIEPGLEALTKARIAEHLRRQGDIPEPQYDAATQAMIDAAGARPAFAPKKKAAIAPRTVPPPPALGMAQPAPVPQGQLPWPGGVVKMPWE
jgi:hypothetical protein